MSRERWDVCEAQRDGECCANSGRTDATRLVNPGDIKNWKDFASYGEAIFDEDPMGGDVAKLDGNGDGRPCERLLPRSVCRFPSGAFQL